MKNFLFLLFFVPVLLSAQIMANTSKLSPTEILNPNLDAITHALNTGDVDAIAKYFGESIEISILDKAQSYNKSKATDAVRAFFNSNKAKSFAQVHQGTSRENSDQYCIGNLATDTGNYRVYIYLKVNGSKLTIQEMRFDKA